MESGAAVRERTGEAKRCRRWEEAKGKQRRGGSRGGEAAQQGEAADGGGSGRGKMN